MPREASREAVSVLQQGQWVGLLGLTVLLSRETGVGVDDGPAMTATGSCERTNLGNEDDERVTSRRYGDQKTRCRWASLKEVLALTIAMKRKRTRAGLRIGMYLCVRTIQETPKRRGRIKDRDMYESIVRRVGKVACRS